MTPATPPTDDPQNGSDLMARLGTGAVATALGLSIPRVSNWRRRGVPRGFRFLVAELAASRGLSVPTGFLPSLASPLSHAVVAADSERKP